MRTRSYPGLLRSWRWGLGTGSTGRRRGVSPTASLPLAVRGSYRAGVSTVASAPELLAPARREPVWDRVRLALLGAWVLVAVAALAVGVRPDS